MGNSASSSACHLFNKRIVQCELKNEIIFLLKEKILLSLGTMKSVLEALRGIQINACQCHLHNSIVNS